jgi:hypothetical protein
MTALSVLVCVVMPFAVMVLWLFYAAAHEPDSNGDVERDGGVLDGTDGTNGADAGRTGPRTVVVVCMDCGVVVVGGFGPVSHGLCRRCYERRMRAEILSVNNLTSGSGFARAGEEDSLAGRRAF